MPKPLILLCVLAITLIPAISLISEGKAGAALITVIIGAGLYYVFSNTKSN